MNKCAALVCTLFLSFTVTLAQTTSFRCTTQANKTCDALIDYIPINATTYSNIQTLFDVKNLRSILGANSLPLSTPPNTTVPAQQKVKIPFPCVCNNGTGISNKRPIYIVKQGDGLDAIARNIFSNLLTFQQIAKVNNIPNPDSIGIGQKLVIPLPCSCDDLGGVNVVHYGYVVPSGSSVQGIALEFGTTESVLLQLNGLDDPNKLMADSVIDVPLRVCTSNISSNSLDYPLLVPNGTYTFTANNCVQCKCENSNNWILQCEPAPDGVRKTNSPQCPSMLCEGGLPLGNTSSCATCAYTGYTNQTILATQIRNSTCPRSPSNDATKNGFQWRSWAWLLISLELGLLGFVLS